jgi:hypothetical protein
MVILPAEGALFNPGIVPIEDLSRIYCWNLFAESFLPGNEAGETAHGFLGGKPLLTEQAEANNMVLCLA